MKLRFLLTFVLFASIFSSSFAIAYDDDFFPKASETDSVEKDEALFDELFEEYPADERDITTPASFDDAIDEAAKILNSYSKIVKEENPSVKKEEQFYPLENDVYLSIVDGSFKIFKDITGKSKCRFSVKLKSEIDREINIIGLSLSYPKRSFAFIFRRVPPLGESVQSIITRGDICYNLSGAPDINVNRCAIKNTSDVDCVSHIKWDDRVN